MKTLTLRDGTKVKVPDRATPGDIKRIAREVMAQRRPAPAPKRERFSEPEILPPSRMQAPDYRAAEMHMLRQELSALKDQNRAMLSTLERIAAKETPDHGDHLTRMNGTLEKMAKPVPAPVDPTPALKELKAAVATSADRIIEAFNAPVTVVKDASGRPVGIKRG
jgi:hypothetical protein